MQRKPPPSASVLPNLLSRMRSHCLRLDEHERTGARQPVEIEPAAARQRAAVFRNPDDLAAGEFVQRSCRSDCPASPAATPSRSRRPGATRRRAPLQRGREKLADGEAFVIDQRRQRIGARIDLHEARKPIGGRSEGLIAFMIAVTPALRWGARGRLRECPPAAPDGRYSPRSPAVPASRDKNSAMRAARVQRAAPRPRSCDRAAAHGSRSASAPARPRCRRASWRTRRPRTPGPSGRA